MLAIGAAKAQDAAPAEAEPEAVIVTGSNIPTSEEVSEAPVDTVDQAARDVTGQEDVESVLMKANPAISSANNNIGSNNASIATNETEGGSQVTIHGLPTLVLLDGRRLTDAAAVAAGGAQFADVNLFPSALVKRIEVLKDGASAIYGSEAVGGVINVILDNEFTGFDFSTRYGFTEKSDIHDERYSGIVGFGDDKTHITIGAEYAEQDPIFNRQRAWAGPSYATTTYAGVVRFPGAPDANGNVPAEVYLLNPGLNSPNDIYAPGSVSLPTPGVNPLPNAYTASNSTAAAEGFDLSKRTTVTADQNRLNVFASGDRQLIGDKVVAFAEFLYADNYAQSYLNPQPAATDYPPPSVVIPVGAPYNPFNGQIDASSYPIDINNRFSALGPRSYRTDTNFYRIVAGLKGEIVKDVTYEVAFNASQDEVNFKNPGDINISALNQAIAGGYDALGNQVALGKYSNVNGNIQPALDFFARNNPAAALQGVLGDDLSDFTTKFGGVDGKVTAFPFTLPAGPLGVAAGGEYRHEDLQAVTSPSSTFLNAAAANDINVGRDVFALFSEVRVPVISPDMKIPGAYSLDIDGAVRFESYSTSGSDTVSKAGFTFRPIKDVAFRGTYSASFIAPNLYELDGPATQGATASVNLGAGQEQANVLILTNPNLSNTRADNYTLGVVVSPSFAPGLNMNLDFFHVEEKGIVSNNSLASIISVNQLGLASPYASLVRFGSYTGNEVTAPGQLAGQLPGVFVTSQDTNLAAQRIGGLDFGLHYTKDFGSYGQLGLGVDGTYYLQYKELTQPGFQYYDIIGLYNGGADTTGAAAAVAQYHLTPSIEYKWGGLTLSALGNYDPSLRNADVVFVDPTPGVGGVNVNKPGSIKNTTGVDYLPVIRDYYTIDLLASYEFGLHKPAPEEMAPSPKEGKDGKGGGKDMKSSATMAKEMVTTKLLDGLKISIGCDNVTNGKPPYIADSPDSTNTDAGIYDPYQRRYYLTLEKKF